MPRKNTTRWIWAKFPRIETGAIEAEFDDLSRFDPPACIRPAIELDEDAFIQWNLERWHDRAFKF